MMGTTKKILPTTGAAALSVGASLSLTGPNPVPVSPLLDIMSLTGRKKGV
jgi:hypothetical protein